MGDAWLIIGIFIFAFILWLSTGGPSKPISFAGPYITPITDVGTTQNGYGPTSATSSSSGLWSLKTVFGRYENTLNTNTVPAGAISPSAGAVQIQSGAGGPSSSSVNTEYVTLHANRETNITGWRLVSAKNGYGGVIPGGTTAPPNGPLTNIVLEPDDEAIVTTGPGLSFRENKCSGYLNYTLVPPLSTSYCPSPIDELSGYTGSAADYDACRQVVSQFSRCQSPNIPSGTESTCRTYILSHYSYGGCVAAHFNDQDYRGTTWRVYLGLNNELWRSDNETITLLDRDGKTVDIYEY